MSTITVTVHLLEEVGDPIATCTCAGPGFTVVSDVRDPRRFDPRRVALEATFAEQGRRDTAKVSQVGTARIASLHGRADRQSLFTFKITSTELDRRVA